MPPETETQQYSPQTQPIRHSHKFFWITIVLLVLLALGSSYYVYSWQHMKVSNLNKLLDSSNSAVNQLQNNVAKSQPITKAAAAVDYHDDLIAGNVKTDCQSGVGLKVCGEIKYKFSLNLTELWVSYGTSTDKLTSETVHVTKELGVGAGDFGNNEFNINHSSLSPGTTYYYRVTGKTKDGKTIQGALNYFTTEK